MAMDGYNNLTNSSTDECIAKFSTSAFKAVAIVRALSGSISVVASLLVILMIILFKKYLFFTQRLILYLSIASMLNALAIALQGATYYPDNEYSNRYCSLSAFFEQTTHWSLLLAVFTITVDIYLRAVRKIQNRTEIICVIVIFSFPPTFNWIPFIHSSYGMAGPWCWIDGHCESNKYGIAYQYILWYIPLYIVVLAIIGIYVIVYVSIRHQRNQYRGNYNPDKEEELRQMTREIVPLLYYPVIFLVLQVPPTMNRIAQLATDEEQLPLWFLHAFFSPLQGGLMCIVYALDPETRARLRYSSWKSFVHYNNGVLEYPVVNAHSDSINDSLQAQYRRLKNPVSKT